MADLTQTILVNLTGSGNLPGLLAGAAAGAKSLGQNFAGAGTVGAKTPGAAAGAGTAGTPAGANAGTAGANPASSLSDTLKIISSLHRQQAQEEADALAAAKKQHEDDLSARKEANKKLLIAAGAAFAGGMGAITGLSGLFNPWALQQFQRATADLGATIGRDLLPYLQTATRFVRDIADAYASLPEPIRSGIAAVIAIGTAAGFVTITIYAVVRGFEFVATTAIAAAAALGLQTTAMANQAAAARMAAGAAGGAGATSTAAAAGGMGLLGKAGMIGMGVLLVSELFSAYGNKANPQGDGSSFGMAARPASVSSIEGYLGELQTDVLSATQRIADNSDKQVTMLDGILNGIQGRTPDGKTKNWADHTEDEKTARIEWGIVTLGISELIRAL